MLCVGCGSLLSGFLRRLFLQVLLEDERVLVCVTAKQPMYKGHGGAGVAGRLQHPKLGVGHAHRCLSISVHLTCGDVLAKVSGELLLTLLCVCNGDQLSLFEMIQQLFELMEWSETWWTSDMTTQTVLHTASSFTHWRSHYSLAILFHLTEFVMLVFTFCMLFFVSGFVCVAL